MKTLILSCNTGQGHNTAGSAMLETLARHDCDCEMRDALQFGGPRASRYISGTYVRITQLNPAFFGRIYRAGEFVSSSRRKSPVYLCNTFYADRLEEYVQTGGFDTILCPHLFPAEALTHLRQRHRLNVRFYGIATDYTCSPFWEETDIDLFFIPHEDLRAEYEKKGFPSSCLMATSIPVSARFRANVPKPEARAKLGLPCGGRVYLMMTGSMGFGDAPAIARLLLKECGPDDRVLIMTGHNPKLEKELADAFSGEPRVQPIAFTKEVPLYMDACDVLLTKPGGLSSTEAAVKNVPLVHTAPIPGCETENARFFSERGMSVATHSSEGSAAAALWLAGDRQAQQSMLAAQQKHVDPLASEKIFDYLLRHSQ